MSSWSRGGSGAGPLPPHAVIASSIVDTHRFSGSEGKEPAYGCRRLGFNPRVRRSPGGGHGKPLQGSCLENRMDRGAWRATVHGVTKSWTWLSDVFLSFTFTQAGWDLRWPWGPAALSPPRLAHLPLALSLCQPQDVAVNSFFFSLKSLFHSPRPIKILFVALSSDLPFQWSLGSSPQQESYLLLSSWGSVAFCRCR